MTVIARSIIGDQNKVHTQGVAEVGLAPRLGRGDVGSNPTILSMYFMDVERHWRLQRIVNPYPLGTWFDSKNIHQVYIPIV